MVVGLSDDVRGGLVVVLFVVVLESDGLSF